MIQNEQQLRQTQEALMDLEASLAALNRRQATIHPDQYTLMAEPVVEHIRRLRAEIDDYLGLSVLGVASTDAGASRA